MIKNYLNTTLRNLFKNKIYSIVNILGLSIAIIASIFIFQYVAFELDYDDYHEKKDIIYRISQSKYSNDGLVYDNAQSTAPLGKTIKENFPEVIEYGKIKLMELPTGIFSYNEIRYREERAYFCTNSILSMFSFEFINGNSRSAIEKPNTVIISEHTAKKYYNIEDPVGKILKLNNNISLEVTGVFRDLPINTHFKCDIIVSFQTAISVYGEWVNNDWLADVFWTYLEINKGTDINSLERRITKYINENFNSKFNQGVTLKYSIQPVKDIHLHSDCEMEMEKNGDARTVYLLLLVAILILVIAWINYINLSTAGSMERAKEVGVRKMCGASVRQLVKQYVFESVLLNILSVCIGIIIVLMVIPIFNNFIGLTNYNIFWNDYSFWLSIFILIIVGAILSSIYPAFVMSSVRPITVLKGSLSNSYKGNFFRKLLICFQYIVSIVLIGFAIAVYQQVSFMRDQDLGINIEKTLIVNVPTIQGSSYTTKFEAFKQEMQNDPNIISYCASSVIPSDRLLWVEDEIHPESADRSIGKSCFFVYIDNGFVEGYNLNVIAGRNFTEVYMDNFATALVTKETSIQLGFEDPKDIIDEILIVPKWTKIKFRVVGVVDDYHHYSLNEGYKPIIFVYNPTNFKYFSLKVNSSRMEDAIASVRSNYMKFFPYNTFDYFFLSDYYNSQYDSDNKLGLMITIFSIVAIILSCLGLYALSYFVMYKRTKEVGLRKVMGASAPALLKILLNDLILLIIVSALVAFPLTYFLVNNWLKGFPFRIDIGIWIFIVPIIVISFIAFLTVIYQVMRVITLSPIVSLKYE